MTDDRRRGSRREAGEQRLDALDEEVQQLEVDEVVEDRAEEIAGAGEGVKDDGVIEDGAAEVDLGVRPLRRRQRREEGEEGRGPPPEGGGSHGLSPAGRGGPGRLPGRFRRGVAPPCETAVRHTPELDPTRAVLLFLMMK